MVAAFDRSRASIFFLDSRTIDVKGGCQEKWRHAWHVSDLHH